MSIIKEMSTKIYNKVVLEQFSTAQEVVDVSGTREVTDSEFHNFRDGSYKVTQSFHGVGSFNEACEMMRTGYQPTVDKLKQSIKAKVSGETKRVSFKNEVFGFQPIVPLAMQNIPTCMVNSYMKPIKTKVLNVYYDMTASCGTKVDEIIRAGQKLLGAIIDLEMQGYKFNLYAMQSYSNRNATYMLSVKVKSANSPLDLKRMSFPLTHTAFFRCIGWDWYSRCPKAKYLSGYGHAMVYDHSQKEIAEMLQEVTREKCVYFSATSIINENADAIKEVLSNDK